MGYLAASPEPLRGLFLQMGLQVPPGVLTPCPDHHLTATTGPWGDKEQPQAHILLEGHAMGPQLQDTTEQRIMRTKRDEAWLRKPQSIVDGDGDCSGPSWELQADTVGQSHRAALWGHGEAVHI